MKLRTSLVASAILFASGAFAQQPNAVARSVSPQSAQLQITQTTEAPGTSLSHGSYAIRIADRLQDRIIVQIQKSGSDSFTSLLAYPNPGLRGGSFTGPITFVSGLKNKPTLRGYAFPGGPVVEFVYPKADAVELAKGNAVRVMAVDPASEGRVSLPNLTQTDMSEVTLWMLTPTPVDPTTSKPGIQAARYQAPTSSQSAAPAQAEASTPVLPGAPAQASYSAQPQPSTPATHRTLSKSSSNAPVQLASNTHASHLRPSVKELPHTASSLPLFVLFGSISFCLAAILSLRRRFHGAQG